MRFSDSITITAASDLHNEKFVILFFRLKEINKTILERKKFIKNFSRMNHAYSTFSETRHSFQLISLTLDNPSILFNEELLY